MPYFRLFYHFVWSTKDRLPLIEGATRTLIYRAIPAKVVELGGILHALGGIEDHIHLVTTLPPKVAPAAAIGQIKGSTSHLITHRSTGVGAAPFAWQTEYGVLSLSERHLPLVVAYVREQAQRHGANRLNPALERCSEP